MDYTIHHLLFQNYANARQSRHRASSYPDGRAIVDRDKSQISSKLLKLLTRYLDYTIIIYRLNNLFLLAISRQKTLFKEIVMLGGVEASCVAGEILVLIEKLKAEYEDEPKVIEALEKIEKKAQEIKTAGDTGWY